MNFNIVQLLNHELVGKYLFRNIEGEVINCGIISDVNIDEDYQIVISTKFVVSGSLYTNIYTYNMDEEINIEEEIYNSKELF